jgi:hypothetical protein
MLAGVQRRMPISDQTIAARDSEFPGTSPRLLLHQYREASAAALTASRYAAGTATLLVA